MTLAVWTGFTHPRASLIVYTPDVNRVTGSLEPVPNVFLVAMEPRVLSPVA